MSCLPEWVLSRACQPCRNGGGFHHSCLNCKDIAGWLWGHSIEDSHRIRLRDWARTHSHQGRWNEVIREMDMADDSEELK